MSKTRVPRLPEGANRAVYQTYVKEVRKYAQSEFKRGATELEIYEAVNKDQVPLPALRSVLGSEYMAFIGITPSNLKTVKIVAMVCAFLFYGVVTSQVVNQSPIYRYGLPALFSVMVFVGVENLGQKFLRARKKPKPAPAAPE